MFCIWFVISKYYISLTDIHFKCHILDFLSGGSLLELRQRNQGSKTYLTIEQVRLATAEIVIAIEQLHQLGISHNDIKSDNVMIGADGHVVIIDFGLAQQFSPPRKLRNDWRAVAEICYQLITGKIAIIVVLKYLFFVSFSTLITFYS